MTNIYSSICREYLRAYKRLKEADRIFKDVKDMIEIENRLQGKPAFDSINKMAKIAKIFDECRSTFIKWREIEDNFWKQHKG